MRIVRKIVQQKLKIARKIVQQKLKIGKSRENRAQKYMQKDRSLEKRLINIKLKIQCIFTLENLK